MAAILLTHLPPEKFAELGAHEQAAITELGAYAEEAVKDLESSPQGTGEEPAVRFAAIQSEADAYLRATLGFERFNQLSFLASGVSAPADDTPRQQRF
ncbi:MAG: hypothetical protein EOP88_00775 [Verrucomicrobiaceae bacterium]|nr:MAG: hypothetical protein EOP88_00775 [Verrucomicrobiaceae bacterium]